MHHPRLIAAALLAAGLNACAPFGIGIPTPTLPPPTATNTVTPAPPPTATATATPLTCRTGPGEIRSHALDGSKPAQELLVYLPPCYDYDTDIRYPVLYLLHGQTFIDDQWVRLGATRAVDNLIHDDEVQPFIMVFPDDRYWNLPPGESFGERLIDDILPFIDRTYRTRAERQYRAIGGLSRGGGWAVHQLLLRYDLFGMVGLHSPVIFNGDAAVLERLIPAVPDEAWPRLWLDAGDRDGDLGSIRRLETLLTVNGVPHEWHIFRGDHTEEYWGAHVVEYMRWYAAGFESPAVPSVVPSPTP